MDRYLTPAGAGVSPRDLSHRADWLQPLRCADLAAPAPTALPGAGLEVLVLPPAAGAAAWLQAARLRGMPLPAELIKAAA